MASNVTVGNIGPILEPFLESLQNESRSRGREPDHDILKRITENSILQSAITFQAGELSQNKDLALAKQLLAQGGQKLMKKQYKEALVCLNTASRFLPHEQQLLGGLYQLRSTVFMQLKNYSLCAVDLERALQTEPPPKLHYKLHDKLAGCYYLLNKPFLAKTNYEKALSALVCAEISEEKKRDLSEHFKQELQTCIKALQKTETVKQQDVKEESNNGEVEAPDAQEPRAPASEELKESKKNTSFPCLSASCKVVHMKGKGRGVIATRDISPGEVLLTEECQSAMLFPDHWADSCWWCLQNIQAAEPCPRCTTAVFCSSSCLQRATDSFHRKECSIMELIKSLSQDADTFLCLFALRVLASIPLNVVLKNKEDATNHGITNGESIRPLVSNEALSVCEFLREMPKDESLDGLKLCLQSTLLSKHFLPPEYQDSQSVFCFANELCKLQRALNITNKSVSYTFIMQGKKLLYHSVRLGRAFWPTLSLLNHSCDPCADALLMNRRGVELRSKRKVLRGEEVTISYTGHYSREDRETRAAALQTGWGFQCKCDACEKDWPQYLTMRSPPMQLSLKCCSCQQHLLKVHSVDKLLNKIMTCQNCNTQQNPELARQILNKFETRREDLRSKLLSSLNPSPVYQEVMALVESLDCILEKPCVYYARWNELVHHLFLLMSDKQIVKE